jgi:hypothetical protein
VAERKTRITLTELRFTKREGLQPIRLVKL